MRRYLYTTLHPEIYHGFKKQPPFFEGWYFKLISASTDQRYAVIPGIFLAEDAAHNHAFIQVLNGVTGAATYHPYPVDRFWAHPERFYVKVGDSTFSDERLVLEIADDQLEISGEVRFKGLTPWPVTPTSPGIMGWYGWLSFMECYHGVVSLDHLLSGQLHVNGEAVSFEHGRGYIEKDWGQNFPSAYVWQQTNHFRTPGTSLTASIALIPFYVTTFRGFIIGLWHYGKLYRFATYTGAVTEQLEITDDHVFWTVADGRYRLEMVSERAEGGLLKAPIRTEMHRRVNETMGASVFVRLTEKSGSVIYEDEGRHMALEVHGDLERLLQTR